MAAVGSQDERKRLFIWCLSLLGKVGEKQG